MRSAFSTLSERADGSALTHAKDEPRAPPPPVTSLSQCASCGSDDLVVVSLSRCSFAALRMLARRATSATRLARGFRASNTGPAAEILAGCQVGTLSLCAKPSMR
jgi:hypothetical protein